LDDVVDRAGRPGKSQQAGRSTALEVPIEVLVRSDGLKKDQPNVLIQRVAQEVQLALALELVNPQVREITLLALTRPRCTAHTDHGNIYIGSNLVVQFLVLPRKSTGLKGRKRHAFPWVTACGYVE
jgi:hypothetical protein